MHDWNGIEGLTFTPGFAWCLHLSPPDDVERLQQSLGARFRADGREVVIAETAHPRTMRKRLFQEPTAVEWLVQNSVLTEESAEQVIAGLPVRVAPLLSHNAGNPRRFLGLAAALSKNPDVLIYETGGMDPAGMMKLHAYVRVRYAGCLIYATPGMDLQTEYCPSQLCPSQGQCLRVRRKTA